MKRKSASIIGRIVGLILVVALAFGITWCATNWSTVKAEISELWNKITGNEQTQPEDPTPVDPTPHEHLWSEWVTTLAPTCFDKGTQTRTCDCGETETQTLPAPGHDYGEDGICINCGFDLNTCNHKNGLSGGYCDECGELVRARHWILNETLNCDVDEPISCDIAFLSWQGSFTKLTVEPGLIRYDEWSPYNSISQNGWPVFDILGPRCLVFEFTPTGEIRDWLDANGTSCSGDSEYCDYLNPTCDCDGYRRVLCSECGIADIFQAAPALGGEHEFVDHVCSRCGAVEAPVITLNDNLLTIEDYTQSLSYCLAGRVYNSYDGGGIHVFSSPILDIASMDYSFYGNCLDPIYISVEAFYWSDDFYYNAHLEEILWYIPHNYVDGTCTHCGVPEENACLHSWVDGVCSICGNACEHNYDNGVCLSCGDVAFYGTWAKSYDDAGDEQINVYVIKDWTCKVYTGKYDENGVLHCCITADSGMTNAYQIDSTQSTGLFSNISVAGPNIVYLFDWEDTYEPLLVYDVEYDVMCDAMGSVKIFRVENFQEHLFEQNEDGNDECKLCGLELTSDWNTNLTATVA